MSEEIYCVKLKKKAKPLGFAPMPGELGNKILENISAEAWQMWLNQQTMLINENNLILSEPAAQEFLQTEMNKFLFD